MLSTYPCSVEDYLDTEVTTLSLCWYLKRYDGQEMGFTNHDCDIVFEGIKYIAKSGFAASAIVSDSSLSVDNLDISCVIDDDIIKEGDILSGLYDHAEIRIFLVNYMNLEAGAVKMRRGWLGEVKISQNHFVVEVRGMLQAFSTQLGEIYSPCCRANLGDCRCKIDLEQYKVRNLSVYEIMQDRVHFRFAGFPETPAAGELLKYLSYGKVTFTTGNNTGISMEIKSCVNDTIQLVLPIPYTIALDDKFDVTTGCDKHITTCCNFFKNSVNFRGEPHIPHHNINLQR